MTTSNLHLVCGPVGAGKTTYGRRLAGERGAVHLVLDQWMQTLFMADAPTPPTFDWMMPRVERALAQIWDVVEQLAGAGIDVVAELGCFRRDERDRVRAAAAARGLVLVVHHLDVPAEVRRRRVRARNQGGDTLTIAVDDGVFDWAEAYYQPLEADELVGAVVVTD